MNAGSDLPAMTREFGLIADGGDEIFCAREPGEILPGAFPQERAEG